MEVGREGREEEMEGGREDVFRRWNRTVAQQQNINAGVAY